MIAALFVEPGGAYYGIADVDPWDEERDARLYPGPWPVVAHPPCARWSKLAGLVEARWGKHKRGEDGGCFASALESVRRWGGILEHPAYSAAWWTFALPRPPYSGGWVRGIEWRVGRTRRAGCVRASRAQADVALRVRRDLLLAVPCLGAKRRRALSQVFELQKRRAFRDPARLP